MMKSPSYLPRILRITAYFLALMIFVLTGAFGQTTSRTLRIGLQRQQTQVRLQGTTSLRLDSDGAAPVTVAADQILTFAQDNGGLTVSDATGQKLLTATCPVRVSPATSGQTATTSQAATPPVIPLICLLGPTRHYDQKPDRPYRGMMEVIPGVAGMTVVNVVDVEDYLLGVVSSEMKPTFPQEALKAQAVAARTYALKNIGRCANLGYDLDDTARCQVYGGFFSEDPRTTQAVNETAGKVLTYNGQLIDAVYSSTCGGYTESATAAWGKPVPYLTSVCDADDVLCPRHPAGEEEWANYCKSIKAFHCLQPKYANAAAFRWVRMITRKELEANLPQDYQVGTVQNIVPLQRGDSGRIMALRIDGSTRSVTLERENAIRDALGGTNPLRSSAFTVETYRDDNGVPVVFALWGAGWGHGLGMCQVGAIGLADQGWSYDKILAFYYRGTSIEQR